MNAPRHPAALLAAFLAFFLCAATAGAQRILDIDLWPEGLPNSNGIDTAAPYDDARRNFKPSVRVFLPAAGKADGRAVVCLPGGAYSHLAMEHEGYDWAPFFNEQGIALVVLKYRMPHGRPEVPVSDAREALRLVRQHAAEWGVDPARVGIMGSSAGGHLASTVATHSDSLSAPAFQILFYPVVTFDSRHTHAGSRANLIGRDPAPELVALYSNELQVTRRTPPAIMLLSDDDRAVPSPNSVNYYLALRANGVPASLHIYPGGGHGWGFRTDFRFHEQMLADLAAWLRARR